MTALPNLRPEEFNILQIVSAMAWADGSFASEERQVLLSMLADLFGESAAEAESLYQALQTPTAALPELVARLNSEDDRELVLKLSYMVIQADSSPTQASDSPINVKEKAAYRQLVDLLHLSDETVEKTEWAADQELKQHGRPSQAVRSRLSEFFGRLR